MKIIFLLSRFPYPLEKGDKLRAYQQLVNMHAAGHEIHLIALSDVVSSEQEIAKVRGFCKSINIYRLSLVKRVFNLAAAFTRQLPLQVGYFYSTAVHTQIDKLISSIQPDLVYCQLIRTAMYIKNTKNIPLLIDYQDAFSRGTFQRMEKAAAVYKPLFKREFRLVNKFEKNSYEWFDGHTIISSQDRDALNIDPSKKVFIVPNGIDTGFFKPISAERVYDITFVGNMNYPPNVDSAEFLVNEIMPLVWKEIPAARVQIGGSQPNRRVKSLASARVTVTGWMDDIRDCYKNSKLFIAPMRIGTGLQNKLLEAMAMKIPCITTPISFEPLNAGKDSEILVGESAEQLATHIISLLNNRELSNRIAENGYRFIIENYSMQHSGKLLEEVLNYTVKKHQQKHK